MFNSKFAIEKAIKELLKEYPDRTSFKKKEIMDAADRAGLYRSIAQDEFCKPSNRVSHGVYSMEAEILKFKPKDSTAIDTSDDDDNNIFINNNEESNGPDTDKPVTPANPVVNSFRDHEAFIPKKDPAFVPWGEYTAVKKIIASNQFFPVYMSGLSGNGKTQMIKHICASLKRQYIRVQITPETDESDLIGSFRLVNGTTEWADGPVIAAAKAGAILLLDELDRGRHNLMSLQGILEGEPVLVKKTGEIVEPKPGFNVIATGNTKGRGSFSGRYTSASILDEALLERFPIDIEHDFPKKDVTQKILVSFLNKNLNITDSEKHKRALNFAEELASFGEIVNSSFKEEAIDETISIRRLLHMMKTFSIFFHEEKSIKMCISRFDETVKEAFIDLYRKISKLDLSSMENSNDGDDESDTDF